MTDHQSHDNPQVPAESSEGEPAGAMRSRGRQGSPARQSGPRRRPAARRLIDTAGPDPSNPLDDVRLTIGVIAGTHGVNGELKLKPLTDHPEHIPTLKSVYLGDSDTPTPLLGARGQGDNLLIKLEGVTTPEAGKRLGGLKVRIAAKDARPLEEGEYFIFQLIGLEARATDGSVIGTVSDLIETGAQDVLVITRPGDTDLLVPNHPSYVIEISPEQNRIVIQPPVYTS